MASPSPRLGFATLTLKIAVAILPQERVKLRTENFGRYIFTGSILTKAHEKFGRKGSMVVSRDKSPLQIWEKRERGRIQGLPNFFEYSIIPGIDRVELQTSHFVRTFIGSIGSKAH